MNYKDLYNGFVNLFPEDKIVFEALESDADVDQNEDGMHIMFDMVIVPYIQKIVNEDPIKTQLAFDYIEKMESDDDPDIANIADVSVLETLMTEEGGMQQYMRYIGPKSLKAARYMSQFFNVKPF